MTKPADQARTVPAMTSLHQEATPCQLFLPPRLCPRSQIRPRLVWLFLGAILAHGRRTVTSWIRAAGLSRQYQPCYTTVAAAGRQADNIAGRLIHEVVKPFVDGQTRLTLCLDDTPTQQYGPYVQGAGIHHSLTPGPAGSPHVHGYIWLVLWLLAVHPPPGATRRLPDHRADLNRLLRGRLGLHLRRWGASRGQMCIRLHFS